MLYTVLPVGQGTGTLVQAVNAMAVPTSSILIDLGSLQERTTAGAASVKEVADRLNKMQPGPTLDAVFLSHPDDDHINLIPDLLAMFSKPSQLQPRNKTLEVTDVWYGGNRSKYKNLKHSNIVDMLEEYKPNGVATNINGLRIEYSNIRVPVFTKDGIEIHILMANAVSESTYAALDYANPISEGEENYLKNTDSLVLIISYGTATKRRIVATGDATGMTMAACVTFLGYNRRTGRKLAPVLSISAPHHGSAVTSYDVLRAGSLTLESDKLAQQVVDAFVDFLQPETVTVSAHEVNAYKLPSLRVLKDFARYADDATFADPALEKAGSADHFYTSYFKKKEVPVTDDANDQTVTAWPKSQGWWTARTDLAVYSTDYFRSDALTDDIPRVFPPDAELIPPNAPYAPKPPWVQGWTYKISQDGATVDLLPLFAPGASFLVPRPVEDGDRLWPTEPLARLALAAPSEPAPCRRPVVVRTMPSPGAARTGRRPVRVLP